ncbi:MAG: DUF1156 domain-containing protein [Proteobacteria bacterium]|nr:DUF1156 domain-containing protein [Pseudomonadota bacterium]
MTPPPLLIESWLPYETIGVEARRERGYGTPFPAPFRLHVWWARRPLAAMRAAIFASLIPAPETDAEREKLEKLIATIVDWDQVKGGNSEAIEEAQRLIREAYTD